MRLLYIGIALLVGCSESPAATIVSKGDIKSWPFTFHEATIRCDLMPMIVLESDKKLYALNGLANSRAKGNGYIKLNSTSPEWLDNPHLPGAKISISELNNFVVSKCDKKE